MKTVLLIDDDQALRQAMALWFHQAGWEVLEADNGVKGLEMAAANHPQLVLCDLLMPRCNGF